MVTLSKSLKENLAQYLLNSKWRNTTTPVRAWRFHPDGKQNKVDIMGRAEECHHRRRCHHLPGTCPSTSSAGGSQVPETYSRAMLDGKVPIGSLLGIPSIFQYTLCCYLVVRMFGSIFPPRAKDKRWIDNVRDFLALRRFWLEHFVYRDSVCGLEVSGKHWIWMCSAICRYSHM